MRKLKELEKFASQIEAEQVSFFYFSFCINEFIFLQFVFFFYISNREFYKIITITHNDYIIWNMIGWNSRSDFFLLTHEQISSHAITFVIM